MDAINILGIVVLASWVFVWVLAYMQKPRTISMFVPMYLSIALAIWCIFDPEIVLK